MPLAREEIYCFGRGKMHVDVLLRRFLDLTCKKFTKAMQLTPELLKKSLTKVQDPDIKRDLVTLGMIQGIEIAGNKVRFTVVLTTPACPLKEVIKNNCLEVLTEDF